MKQVLLAINGEQPTFSVFQYAVDLCKRIDAKLSILQFLNEQKYKTNFSSTKKKVKRIGRFLENSFADIALAEEGSLFTTGETSDDVTSPLQKLLAAHKNLSLHRVAFCGGNPEKDLPEFIEEHQGIVLTIFDPTEDSPGSPSTVPVQIKKLKKKIDVPFVIVHPA